MIVCRDGQIIHQYKTSNCSFVPHDLVYLVHEDRKETAGCVPIKDLECVTGTGVEYCFNRLSRADELLGREMTTMVEDNDGSLWLATNNNGIVHVTGDMERPESLQCKNYCMENGLLSVNTPLCFLLDRSGTDLGRDRGQRTFVYMMCKMIVSSLFIRSLICPEIWLAVCRKIIVVICGWAPIKGWQS